MIPPGLQFVMTLSTSSSAGKALTTKSLLPTRTAMTPYTTEMQFRHLSPLQLHTLTITMSWRSVLTLNYSLQIFTTQLEIVQVLAQLTKTVPMLNTVQRWVPMERVGWLGCKSVWTWLAVGKRWLSLSWTFWGLTCQALLLQGFWLSDQLLPTLLVSMFPLTSRKLIWFDRLTSMIIDSNTLKIKVILLHLHWCTSERGCPSLPLLKFQANCWNFRSGSSASWTWRFLSGPAQSCDPSFEIIADVKLCSSAILVFQATTD